MNIYKLKSDNSFSSTTILDDGVSSKIYYHVIHEDYEFPVPDLAACQRRVRFTYYEKRREGFADFMAGGNGIVVERGVRDVLYERLSAYGEWLEVIFEDRLIYSFRVNNVFNAITNKSIYRNLVPGFRSLKTPVFPDELGDKSFIFKAIGTPVNIFVNEDFKVWIEELGLTGLIFERMPLDSEMGENQQLS